MARIQLSGLTREGSKVALAAALGLGLVASPAFASEEVDAYELGIKGRVIDDCAAVTDALAIRNLCGNSLTNAPEIVAIVGANYEFPLTDSVDIFFNGQARMESDRRTSTQARATPATAAQLGLTPLNPFDVQDGKTKINLRAGVKDVDGAWALEAWVTNLTDQVTRGVTFNTALRSGSRSAFPQEPRMYGLTLRGKF